MSESVDTTPIRQNVQVLGQRDLETQTTTGGRPDMTADRQTMVEAAIRRAPVRVSTDEGILRRATLIAWEPKRGDRRRRGWARVEFASGARCSVRVDRITLDVEAVEAQEVTAHG